MSLPTAKKVRVFELAKSLSLDTKAVLDYCRELGFDVKNQLSSLESEQVESLKQRIARGGRPGGAAAPAPKPAPLPKVEKKIQTLPPARRAETAAPPEQPPAMPPEPPPAPPPAPPAEAPGEPSRPPLPSVDTSAKVPVLTPPRPAAAPMSPTAGPPPAAPAEPVPGSAVASAEEPKVEAPSRGHAAPPPGGAGPTPAPATPAPPTHPPAATPAADVKAVPTATVPAAPAAAPPAPPTKPSPPPASTTTEPRAPGPPTPLPPVGPARVQTLPTRPPTFPSRPTNLSSRPPTLGAPPATARPARSTTPPSAPARPATPATPTLPPSSTPASAAGTRPAPTAAVPPPGRSTPTPSAPRSEATGTGDRHRRTPAQRTQGILQRPAAPASGGTASRPGSSGTTAAPPSTPVGRRFTPEEIRALREGRSLHEITRQREQTLAPTVGRDDEDDEGRPRKGTAGSRGVGERDRRAAERARRTEQRKQVKTKDIVLGAGGEVDIADETYGSRRGPRAALLKKQRRQQKGTVERKGKVPISLPITVRSLSEAIGMKAAELLFKLKDLTNALFTINSTVDTEVAELIAAEKGVELDIQRQKTAEEELFVEHEEAAGDESKLEPRPPIVTIMGHVDHGKTTLLDTIRRSFGLESDVVSTEAGGITQVLRAWRVEKDGKSITFLDTPGHEAFTKMRARGANVTDIAVIVVAADAGVQPQTEEAVSHARAANVSIIVAINKIDVPGADPNRVERQLYNLGLLPDTMGGDVQFVRVSALKGTGIAELLETILLVAELKELKANPHKSAHGTCLEAHLTADQGVLATFLVQQGTLHRGDIVVCGATYGRVRAMYDDLGRPIQEAGPSVPVRITGLDDVPNADDHFHAVSDLAKAREIAERRREKLQEASQVRFTPVTLDQLGAAKTKVAELKIILKAEARGSVEAIRKELEKLVHDEVRVRVLHAGVGAITEGDVQLALASPHDSMIVGFNVVPDDAAVKLAEERGIPIREYNIIYKLTEDIKAALEGKLKPEEKVIHLGRAVVRQLFKISKVGTAAGCYVTQGVIERSARIRVIRDGAVVYPPGDKVASLESLKRFKEDVREVKEGYDCGLKVAGYDDIKVGDVIEAFRVEQVQRTL